MVLAGPNLFGACDGPDPAPARRNAEYQQLAARCRAFTQHNISDCPEVLCKVGCSDAPAGGCGAECMLHQCFDQRDTPNCERCCGTTYVEAALELCRSTCAAVFED